MKKSLLLKNNFLSFPFCLLFLIINYADGNYQDHPKGVNSTSANHSAVQTTPSSKSSDKSTEKKKHSTKKNKGTEIKHQSSNQSAADSIKAAKNKEKGIK